MRSHREAWVLWSSAFLLAISVPLVIRAQGQLPASNPPAASPNADASQNPQNPSSGYVGAETCKTCHDEIYSLYIKTKHRQTLTDTGGGPSKQG